MNNPFFLTRHTANLMEDFVRELNAQAGLYLIHGDEGVGKTRLLTELVGSRLGERKVRWMDLKAGASGDTALIDSSDLIENTFVDSSPGDVIIADHFESALKKTRHQLFLSWSTDGLDKNLNLIVASSSDYMNELKQLAQQYQIRVKRFQVMPFSPDEATAFLGFYLFPDRPSGELTIPPLLRNQLAMAQGNVGKIIDIAERAGDQIGSAPINDSEPTRRGSRNVIGVAIAAALLLVVGWFYLGREKSGSVSPAPVAQVQPANEDASAPDEVDSMPATEPDAVAESAEADAAVSEVSRPAAMRAIGSVSNEADDALPRMALETSSGADAELIGDATLKTSVEASDEPRSADDPPAQATEKPADTPTVASESSSNAVAGVTATEEFSAPSDPAEHAAWGSVRLGQDLQASLDWIATRELQTGTLQIMLLSQARFNEQAYYKYLDRLASQGVELSKIRVFESYIGEKAVLNVVYGEYPSRAAAYNAVPDLPPVLRKVEPFARSVGNLLEKIRRLGEQN